MSQGVLSVFVLFSGVLIGAASADSAAVFFPPFELRAVPTDRMPAHNFETRLLPDNFHNNIGVLPADLHRTTDARPSPTEPVAHVVPAEVAPPEKAHMQKNETPSVNTVHDLLDALGFEGHKFESEHENDRARSSEQARQYEPGYDHPYPSYPSYPEYGYHTEHPHGYWQPPPHHDEPYTYHSSGYGYPIPPQDYHSYPPYMPKSPPLPLLPKLLPSKPALPKPIELPKPLSVLPKPNLDLGSKLQGLLGLITTLLSGKSIGSGLTGLSGTLLNSLLKPLLESKQQLKTLIGKLSVPLIILVLVNLELLVLIWWLWEDCPAPAPAPAPVPEIYKPAAYKTPGPYNAYYR